MPEDVQGQAPPAGSGTNPPPAPPEGTADQPTEGLTPEATAAELARARTEAAKYRTELRDAKKALTEAEKAQKERDDADKSELQKANERATVAEARANGAEDRLRDARLESAVVNASVAHGIVDPDAAYRLLDKDAVEFDGDRPTNIDTLLTALVTAKPYLKGKPTAVRGSSTSPTSPATGNKAPLTRADVERMTDAEINERWDEVQKVLAST